MSKEGLHLEIMDRLGHIDGKLDGIDENVKRINGSVARVTDKADANAVEIANLKGRAAAYGAVAGSLITLLSQILSRYLK